MKPAQPTLETQVFSTKELRDALKELAAGNSTATPGSNDLGISAELGHRAKRILNRDGTFNVRRRGHHFFGSKSLYHYFLNASWPKFFGIFLVTYLSLNVIFAELYFLCGPDALEGARSEPLLRLVDSFFFSVQTFATIGYGHIAPRSLVANLLVTVEALFGLLTFALATGLLFARFSRPTARLRFSTRALIAPVKGHKAFQFRMVNERSNQLINVEVRLVMSRMELVNGQLCRRFHELQLERRQVMFFPLSWSITHIIDEESPLYGISEHDLSKSDAEFLVLFNGTDDTFSQVVYATSSYKYNEVIWGAEFCNILEEADDGSVIIDLDKLDDIRLVENFR